MYGIKLTAKNEEKVLVLGDPYEYRNSEPVFAIRDGELNGSHLMSASQIKASWKAWVSPLLRENERLSIEDAESSGVEII